ncbi:MAG TPA: RNA-binding S4 domain-containing protein [Candidatus Polarisedimenticolia bacterium]|nr:RNA-binding S4 domain-containing protein [Candidatus Polarisedimenticolia bacterium]
MSEAPASEVPVGQPGLRLDKWLWHARFCRTRVLAAELAAAGKVRIAGAVISKAHYAVKPGDVLTFPLGPHIRTVKVLALGIRRGPAATARLLYEDLAPPPPYSRETHEEVRGGRRPTKADRRAIDRFRGEEES